VQVKISSGLESHFSCLLTRGCQKVKYLEKSGNLTGKQTCNTIRYKSLTWTRKLSIQLNLAHVARN